MINRESYQQVLKEMLVRRINREDMEFSEEEIFEIVDSVNEHGHQVTFRDVEDIINDLEGEENER